MTLYDVVNQIAPIVAESGHIHAMWIEGSWATGRNNDKSDIDVWLDVDDGSFEKTISAFREALKSVGTIDWEKAKGIYSNEPKLLKHTYHLEGFPELQFIELDMQEHSRNYIFDHDNDVIVVLFDKKNVIRWKN